MGVFKKFRGGYSHECAQAQYYIVTSTATRSTTVPTYKDESGTSRTVVCSASETGATYVKNIGNSCLPYFNLRPVPMSIGLYESALGLIYDSSETYYTSNEGTTVADMSGYSNGDTITDNVYYCTYDVEDYDISTNAVGGTKTESRAETVGTKSKTISVTITINNTTESSIIIKSVKFWNTVMINYNTIVNVLKCAYYLAPSEYVTIPSGETGAVTVVLEFGETT